jgi:hypothetical protein
MSGAGASIATRGSRFGSPIWPIELAKASIARVRTSSLISAYMIRSTEGARSRYFETSRWATCSFGDRLSTSTVPSYQGVAATAFFFALVVLLTAMECPSVVAGADQGR